MKSGLEHGKPTVTLAEIPSHKDSG